MDNKNSSFPTKKLVIFVIFACDVFCVLLNTNITGAQKAMCITVLYNQFCQNHCRIYFTWNNRSLVTCLKQKKGLVHSNSWCCICNTLFVFSLVNKRPYFFGQPCLILLAKSISQYMLSLRRYSNAHYLPIELVTLWNRWRINLSVGLLPSNLSMRSSLSLKHALFQTVWVSALPNLKNWKYSIQSNIVFIVGTIPQTMLRYHLLTGYMETH